MSALNNRPSKTHRYAADELTKFEPLKAGALRAVKPPNGMPAPAQQRPRKGRRATTEMLSDLDTALERADYALGRIRRLEDQIANLLDVIGKDASTLVINERPSLKVYLKPTN